MAAMAAVVHHYVSTTVCTTTTTVLALQKKGKLMNWDQIEGRMQQVGGKLKEKWAKLTDDDLLLLRGKKEVFVGKLQERSGLEQEEAERQLDAFLQGLVDNPDA